jgi:hypothetical protein
MPDIAHPPPMTRPAGLSVQSSLLIAVIGFLTLVDLFATQAILPSLAEHYGVSPSQIGLAANASTLGMAISGLLVGVIIGAVERKRAITISLALLAVPTALLSFAPDLTIFALLRVTQGLFMAAAFTLTLAHLAERCAARTAGALAAYVTGVVASNLVGRLTAAYVASLVGAEQSFLFFALLNLCGAGLVAVALDRNAPQPMARKGSFWTGWAEQLSDGPLRRTFAIGFLILGRVRESSSIEGILSVVARCPPRLDGGADGCLQEGLNQPLELEPSQIIQSISDHRNSSTAFVRRAQALGIRNPTGFTRRSRKWLGYELGTGCAYALRLDPRSLPPAGTPEPASG